MTQNNQKGTILLISLIVTSVILVGGVIVSEIVIRELSLAAKMQNAFLAYYGADTAIETGLYELRKNWDKVSPVSTLNGTGSLGNGVTWSREFTNKTTDIAKSFIAEDENFFVDIFSTASLDGLPGGVEKIRIDWQTGIQMRVTLREWDGIQFVSETPTTYLCGGVIPCTPIEDIALIAGRAYQIEIHPLLSSVNNVHVKAYANDGDGLGSEMELTTPVRVFAQGQYRSAQKALNVTVPQLTPWER